MTGADRPFPDDQTSSAAVDETTAPALAYDADGLVAVAATSAIDGRLLMIAWANEQALQRTLDTGEAHYWSRSRSRLWKKGETSGNVQRVREIRIDCDQDALEYVVEEAGPACHTGRRTCFYRRIVVDHDSYGQSTIALATST
ncbi:MAG: phosphoribosyl-AMP cyclohydrolase [Alphaproteobacteria bacterium]|nr:phosphoribosyl-AMP cyclohydrolase [Alphaproteobacteria bacterium]